jgi:hypothetical protein
MMVRFVILFSGIENRLIINNVSCHFSGEAAPAKSVSVRVWMESGFEPQKLTNRPFRHYRSHFPTTLLRVKQDTPAKLICHILSAVGAVYL